MSFFSRALALAPLAQRPRSLRSRARAWRQPPPTHTLHYNRIDGRALRGASRRRLFFVRKNSSPYKNTGKGNRSSTRVRVACERGPHMDMHTRYNSRHSFLNRRRRRYTPARVLLPRPSYAVSSARTVPHRLVRDLAASPPPPANARRPAVFRPRRSPSIGHRVRHKRHHLAAAGSSRRPSGARAGTRQQQARTVTTAVIPTTEHLSASIRRFPYLFWAPGTSFRHPHLTSDIFRSMHMFPRHSETFPVNPKASVPILGTGHLVSTSSRVVRHFPVNT
jgi:hypothetical protein